MLVGILSARQQWTGVLETEIWESRRREGEILEMLHVASGGYVGESNGGLDDGWDAWMTRSRLV